MKVVSSKNGIIISSCTSMPLPMLHGHKKAGYHFMVGEISGFWENATVCWCRWKKDQGDQNLFRSQSHPSMQISIGTVLMFADRNFGFEFTFLASDCWGGQQGIMVFGKVKEGHWEEN